MSDDHDWVARLLAASGPATMPDDVARRLERALRAEAEGAGTTALPVADPAPAATPGQRPRGRVGSAPSARTTAASGSPRSAAPDSSGERAAPEVSAAASAGAVVPAGTSGTPGTAAADRPGADGLGADGLGADGLGADPLRADRLRADGADRLAPDSSGPAVVPPTATGSTTGSMPRLRSVSTGGDGPGAGAPTSPSGDPAGSPVSPSSRRPAGSSRRELRAEDQGERRRRSLARWAPVAAGVLVLGGAAVAVGTQFGGGADEATVAQEAGSAAGGAAESATPPRVLLATGTQYSTAPADRAAFEAQVRDLVALAATDAGADVAGGEAADEAGEAAGEAADEAASDATSDASSGTAATVEGAVPGSGAPAEGAAPLELSAGARAAAVDSPLASPQALAECIDEVTRGASSTAVAVDLAVVNGLESTLLVVPDAAGLTYQVYVVGPGCTDIDTRFTFVTVTP